MFSESICHSTQWSWVRGSLWQVSPNQNTYPRRRIAFISSKVTFLRGVVSRGLYSGNLGCLVIPKNPMHQNRASPKWLDSLCVNPPLTTFCLTIYWLIWFFLNFFCIHSFLPYLKALTVDLYTKAGWFVGKAGWYAVVALADNATFSLAVNRMVAFESNSAYRPCYAYSHRGSNGWGSASVSRGCGFKSHLGQDVFTYFCPLRHMRSEWNYPNSVSVGRATPILTIHPCLYSAIYQAVRSSGLYINCAMHFELFSCFCNQWTSLWWWPACS